MHLRPPNMVHIPGGRFLMGKDGSRADEAPAHMVTVHPFEAAEAPVTNVEYAAFVEATGGALPPFLPEARFAAPQLPVVGISWFEAVAYCDWLSEHVGGQFRLPTEAEREFAALG
ncbi:MAG: SUMF1/EgtB/PvdO family nonheme iron enzyme, partial [bacterium]